MKRMLLFVISCLLCVGLAACENGTDTAVTSPSAGNRVEDDSIEPAKKRPLVQAQSSLFDSLTVSDGEPVTAVFTVDLAETEAVFLVVEVAADVDATARYTYHTQDRTGAAWGYYPIEEKDKTSFPLEAATEEAFQAVWGEKTVHLKQGANHFYLTGDQLRCQMRFELSGIDKDQVTYVGMADRARALEKVAPLE